MTKVMTKKDYVHTILIIFFMFGFGFLPPFGPLTQLGMQILGIFIGCIYGWTIGEMIWPSLLSLIAVGFTDYSTVSAMFTSAFGNQTLLIVLFSLIFCFKPDTFYVWIYFISRVIDRILHLNKRLDIVI